MIAASAEFVRGLRDPWRGLGFLMARPALWPLAALPFFLSLALYAAAAWIGWHFMGGWLDRALLESDDWWRRGLGYILAFVFWALLLIMMAVVYIPVAALLANPFNDLLSSRVERLYGGTQVEEEPFSVAALWRALRVGLAGEIKRSLTLGLILAFALCLNLIPLVGSVAAAALSTAATIAFLSLEFTSFSMDRRLYTWDQKKAFLRRRRARTLGFGAMAFLILMTPIASALFIPVSAIAGTLLFCDAELGGPAQPPPLPRGN